MSNQSAIRYSDEELLEFKTLIEEKIAKAEEELEFSRKQIKELSETGFHQQGGDWYDDTSSHAELEMLNRIIVRQMKHIQDLKNAIHRINNKTYGICSVTGVLIDKQRLRAVPHATKSVDGKNLANKNQKPTPTPNDTLTGLSDASNSVVKPVGGNMRLNSMITKRTIGDDWEPNNENMEDAGYRTED